MHMQSTIYKGKRWSTADAYLRPNSERPNLHIVTGAHVSKVIKGSFHQVKIQISFCTKQALMFKGKEND